MQPGEQLGALAGALRGGIRSYLEVREERSLTDDVRAEIETKTAELLGELMKDEPPELLLMTMKHAGAKRRFRDRLGRARRELDEVVELSTAKEEAPSEGSTVKTDGIPAVEDAEALEEEKDERDREGSRADQPGQAGASGRTRGTEEVRSTS